MDASMSQSQRCAPLAVLNVIIMMRGEDVKKKIKKVGQTGKNRTAIIRGPAETLLVKAHSSESSVRRPSVLMPNFWAHILQRRVRFAAMASSTVPYVKVVLFFVDEQSQSGSPSVSFASRSSTVPQMW